MRRARRVLGRVFGGVAVLLAAFGAAIGVAAAATARRGDRRLYPARAGGGAVRVYVVRNWLHANLAVPSAALRGAGPAGRALEMLPGSASGRAPWVLLGWGDAKHYRERGKTRARALDLWRSFLKPGNPSVIHIEPLDARPTPETLGKPVLALDLSRAGFDRLTARLNASFATAEGRPLVAGRGRNPDALFFRSVEGADLSRVCNHWIAHLMHAAGVPTTPVADTVTAGLAWDLKLRGGAADVAGAIGAPRDPGAETPPVYSGRFAPASAGARRAGAVEFEGYQVRFGAAAPLRTEPIDLVRADAARPGAPTWAEILDVPADSLVETRRVVEAGGGGGGPEGLRAAPARSMALGFRTDGGRRYEIALGLFTTPEPLGDPCAVIRYRQP